MALRADALEGLLAAPRVAREVEGGFVALQHCLAAPRRLLQQRARQGADRGIFVHDQVALLAEVQAPGLDISLLQGRDEQPGRPGLA